MAGRGSTRQTRRTTHSVNAEGDEIRQTTDVAETEVETEEGPRVIREERTSAVIYDEPGSDLPSVTRIDEETVSIEDRERGREGPTNVITHLGRSALNATADLPLWWIIEESTDALSFRNYRRFTDYVLCNVADELDPEDWEKVPEWLRHQASLSKRRFLPFTDTDAYRLLKVATEAFVSVNCGVKAVKGWNSEEDRIGDTFNAILQGRDIVGREGELRTQWLKRYLRTINRSGSKALPYLAIIRSKLADVPLKRRIFTTAFDLQSRDEQDEELCYGILTEKLANPCLLELIWSYWHEQGMLVQTMNVLSRRFQNIRGSEEKDPLAMIEMDPLRPLNNLLWGYLQDEQHRLSVVRRAYEYDHEYGLILEGKAVPTLRSADSRSKFLDSFHNLLYLATVFYRQDDDTTVVSDAFPLLVALRDVHMLLAEGAHNQFGDMPSTARIEMLMQEWLLARPEFREVLPTRIMVDYPEPWMERVDAMKRLQGWTDTSVMHFHDLGHFGEQILLSIRFGNWNEADRDQAKVWARWWRSAIQHYIHSYRIVTGVDLTADATQPQQRSLIAAQPSALLRQRLPGSANRPALPPASTPPPATSRFRERRALRGS